MISKFDFSIMVRLTAYLLVIAAYAGSLPYLIQQQTIEIFHENGLIEWMQLGLLVAATAVFLVGVWRHLEFRQLLLLLASVTAFAAIREMDDFFDHLIPWLSWMVGVVFPAYAFWLLCRNFKAGLGQFSAFQESRAFAVIWAGCVIAVPIAQLFGHSPLLRLVMEEHDVRNIKRLFEESGELVGYFVLLVGSIETLIQLKLLKPEKY